MNESDEKEKETKVNGEAMVGKVERFAYGIGDFGFQLAWGTIGAYWTFFLTDMFGIPAIYLVVMFSITRVWDGVNDMIMGLIADKTPRGKNGRYRPYIKWGAIPLGIVTILAFTAPEIPLGWKVVWAYATFILVDLTFTIVNLPYCALLPSMTTNYNERNSLNAIRMSWVMFGAILVNAATLPLYKLLGGTSLAAGLGRLVGSSNDASGMTLVMTIYMLIGVPALLFCYAKCRERVVVEEPKETIPLRQKLKTINLPWFIMVLVNFFMWTGRTMMMSSAIYYMTYVVNKPILVSLAVPVTMMSIFPGIWLTPIIAKKLNNKKIVVILGNLIAVMGGVTFFLSGGSIPVLIVACFLSGLGLGPQSALVYSMTADTVDYGEWKSGVRAQGFLFSAGSFGVKMGTAVGGIMLTALLAWGNYVPNVAQTDLALKAITLSFIGIPTVLIVLNMIVLLFYKLDGKKYAQVKADLLMRRTETIVE